MRIKWGSALALLFLSMLVDVSSVFAAEDSEYNFSWLDPDKKIYVLQNRRFTKAGSIQASLLGGISLGDTYRSVVQVQPRIGYWLTEDSGIEAFYSARFHSPNNAYTALQNVISLNPGVLTPLIREVSSQFGILYTWAPWYAKINVFNTILHFDWYFSGGAGVLGCNVGTGEKATALTPWTTENLFAVYLGTGQMFHLSDHWQARIDFLGHFYSAAPYSGASKTLYSNFAFNLGVGYQL